MKNLSPPPATPRPAGEILPLELRAEGRWIAFWKLPRYTSRITEIFEVRTSDRTQLLGEVGWYAPWRKYAFFPQANRIFEASCLRDVATFCEDETLERQAARRKEREA